MTESHSLADITLRWMVREVMADSDCGIQFDTEMMSNLGVCPDFPPELYFSESLHEANASTHSPQAKGTEIQPRPSARDRASDGFAAFSTIHDEMVRTRLWWILEVIPMAFAWQDKDSGWHKKRELHLGRGRYCNDTVPLLFHETVRMRMKDASLKYKPRMKYEPEKVKYVW